MPMLMMNILGGGNGMAGNGMGSMFGANGMSSSGMGGGWSSSYGSTGSSNFNTPTTSPSPPAAPAAPPAPVAGLCCACVEAPSVFLVPRCSHVCLCEACLGHLAEDIFTGESKCPMCRQVFHKEDAVRVHIS